MGRVGGEGGLEALVLPVGEVVLVAAQDVADAVERVPPAPPPPVRRATGNTPLPNRNHTQVRRAGNWRTSPGSTSLDPLPHCGIKLNVDGKRIQHIDVDVDVCLG